MNLFFEALPQYSFLQHALLAGLLAGVGCAVMGTYVVVKRITYLAAGIAHAALGGMGVAYFFSAAPMSGALVSAVVAAVIIGFVRLKFKEHEDVLIGAIWAAGMALGLLFLAWTPGYGLNLMSYLFGSILLVSTQDLWFMFIMDAAIVAVAALCHRQFVAVCFDEEFARVRGVSVDFYYLLLLCLVALTVVLMIRVVGLILVIALLTLPAAIALRFAAGLRGIMIGAGVLGVIFNTLGLAVSYAPNWPVGPTIVLIAALSYVVVTLGSRFAGSRRIKI